MSVASPVLVTGASGFVGSALVGRLVADNCRVVCLARSGSRVPASAKEPTVEWIATDRHDPSMLRALLGDLRPAVVFNLAAYGVHPEDHNASAMIDGNVGFLADLLAAVADRPPRRFFHVGSCSEYGSAPEGARLSEKSPLDPPTLYGAAKVSAALFGRNLAQRLEVPFVTLRLFGVYGPGETSHRLIPYLIDRLRNDLRVDLTPGEQLRDLTFIDDMVDALVSATQSAEIEDFQSYNVCSGVPVRIRDIARSVCRLMGKSEDLLGLGFRPYRQDEPMSIVGDPTRFQSATGWVPRVALEDGIVRMLKTMSLN